MNIVVASGGFDPIHSGHISYLNHAKKLGDYLIVALNSDEWLRNKKGKSFMTFIERKIILENLNMVDRVIEFDDDSKGSCIDALEKIKKEYPNDKIIFANGGDRNNENIPEMNVSGIDFKFSVGGNKKINSSSSILKNFLFANETRIWGNFLTLLQDRNFKLKELVILPGKGMSLQKHNHRNEIWFISKGRCMVNYHIDDPNLIEKNILNKHDTFKVYAGSWHQIFNPYNDSCNIIEIQYGDFISEEDITRLSYYEKNES